MSNLPRAVKAHRVRKQQTRACLEGGKSVRKTVERVFARQRFIMLPCPCGEPHERWEHHGGS